MKKPIVAIMLDGVLAHYDRNRGGIDIGRPREGAANICRWLKEELGCIVVVVTGRRRTDIVETWLDANGFSYDLVNEGYQHPSVQDASSHWVIADFYLFPENRVVTVTSAPDAFAHALDSITAQVTAAKEREGYNW